MDRPQKDWDVYYVDNKIYHLPRIYTGYDMILRYERAVCIINKEYVSRSFIPTNLRPWELTCVYYYKVILPMEDMFLLELIEKVDHNELWTNMVFMDKFRERLIYYGLYYESK